MKLSPFILVSWAIAGLNASPVSPVAQKDVKRQTAATISEAQLSKFKLMAEYTAATRCVTNVNTPNSPLTCISSACPLVEQAKAYTVIEATFDSYTDNTGFLALDPLNELIVLAFSGSKSIRNYLADILITKKKTEICADCKVHEGFNSAWESAKILLIPAIQTLATTHPTYRIVATGHSFGAAIATLAAADLRKLSLTVDLYAFGSPRLGNNNFAQFVTAQAPALGENFRVTHVADPVPRLPPMLLGYSHISPEFWLSTGNATTIDYNVSDVKVCAGIDSKECNAGLVTFNTEAHVYYLTHVAACGEPLSFKRGFEGKDSSMDLEQLLSLDLGSTPVER